MDIATEGRSASSQSLPPALDIHVDDGTLRLRASGDWSVAARAPSGLVELPAGVQRIALELASGTTPDARLLARLRRVMLAARERELALDLSALPPDTRRILDLALAVLPPRATPAASVHPWPARIGEQVLAFSARQRANLSFVGETVLGFVALLAGRGRYHKPDFLLVMQDVSTRALPIVSLVALLFGAVLAFVSSLQLRPFGAQIFVANLVGSGMALEMGGLLTAVVMAGRAGAAFAAQIGTMQVNEEIDALRTAGLAPVPFLVVPRVVALGIMTPLLTMYADVVGMAGGLGVAVGMLDISAASYWTQTLEYLTADQFAKGIFKSVVFGVLIAMAGCLRGMQCGRSAQAVGEATTSAVVTSIVAIVIADAIITVLIFELDL